MKLSIIISVLNSHEIIRRQLLNYAKLDLEGVEFLYMDDSSTPPLSFDTKGMPIYFIPVNNPAPRVDGMFYDGRLSIARNMGARLAKGEFLLMTDIDYIIRQENINAGRNLKYDQARFKRQFGVILEDGTVTQDLNILTQYGLTDERIKTRGVDLPPHPNNFIMRKSTFFDMGGYRENLQGIYPSGADTHFKRDWTEYLASGKATQEHADNRTTLLMFPNGQYCGDVDYNPFGLFHTLTRKTDRNYWYKKQVIIKNNRR